MGPNSNINTFKNSNLLKYNLNEKHNQLPSFIKTLEEISIKDFKKLDTDFNEAQKIIDSKTLSPEKKKAFLTALTKTMVSNPSKELDIKE